MKEVNTYLVLGHRLARLQGENECTQYLKL